MYKSAFSSIFCDLGGGAHSFAGEGGGGDPVLTRGKDTVVQYMYSICTVYVLYSK